jgi:hypothetical protein
MSKKRSDEEKRQEAAAAAAKHQSDDEKRHEAAAAAAAAEKQKQEAAAAAAAEEEKPQFLTQSVLESILATIAVMNCRGAITPLFFECFDAKNQLKPDKELEPIFLHMLKIVDKIPIVAKVSAVLEKLRQYGDYT